MAKKQVTYVGTADDTTQVVEQYGHTFTKGEAVDIDDGDPNFAKFENNPTFEIGKSSEPEVQDEEAELQAVRAELDGRGVKYRDNASLTSLRGLLAKNAE